MKFLFGAVLLACVVLATSLVSCQTERRQRDPGNEDIDRWAEALVDALMEHPKYQESLNADEFMTAFTDALMENPKYQEYLYADEEWAKTLVDAQMANPQYLEWLYADEEWAKTLIDAQMANPQYLEWLYADDTTPEEDCAAIILSTLVELEVAMTEDYTTPSDSEVDRLCAWYIEQVE